MSANPHSEIGVPPRVKEKKSHFGFLFLVLFVAIALTAGIVYELSQRKIQQEALASAVTKSASEGPAAISVGRVRVAPSDPIVEIPGQTVALLETPLYARTDGYLKTRNVEIGQRVKKGDLLIELDTPDLDQQIDQARATLAQSKAALAQLQASVAVAKSNLKLAQVTGDRTKALTDAGVLSRQDGDNSAAALESAQASLHVAEENVNAQQSVIAANDANVKRLLDTKNYARMEAPYDGVITYRNAQSSDVGTLITSGSATSAREILRISQIQPLRIFVNVPQVYVPMIHVDQTADLVLEELPGQVFPAKVQSTASAVDPASRAMLVILVVDNSKGTLVPGMYAKIRFKLPRQVNLLRLPAEALITGSDGSTVAVVGEDRVVHLKRVTLGRDYGSELEVTSGLSASDRVVLNPTDGIREGVTVEIKESGK